MSVRAALDRFWYAPMPAERLAWLRAAIGAYALVYLSVRAPNLVSVTGFPAGDFEPVGVARWLAAPLPAWVVYASWVLAFASGCAFVAGFKYRIAAPLFAFMFLWVTSYRNSWGMVFHTENLPALHLGLLAFAPAADALSLDARARGTPTPASSGAYGWAVRAIAAVTVVTYVLAGSAKLRLGGDAWLGGELLRAQVAYDNLRKLELGGWYSPLGAWLVKYSWPFRIFACASLALELGAPLALLHPRIARCWVGGVFSFHVGVLATMMIAFPYQLSGVAYLAFFPLERWAQRARGRVG